MMYRRPQATQTRVQPHIDVGFFLFIYYLLGSCTVNREVKQFRYYKRSIINVCFRLPVFTVSARNTQRDS